MDIHTPEQRSRNMSAIKNKNTKIELILGKALWAAGVRYRKNDKTVTGKPDFALKRLKIAVFCDGEFFHGKDWENQKGRIKTNSEFWIKKIEDNITRDGNVNQKLESEGWTVLRFWGNDIKKHTAKCVEIILSVIESRKRNISVIIRIGTQ